MERKTRASITLDADLHLRLRLYSLAERKSGEEVCRELLAKHLPPLSALASRHSERWKQAPKTPRRRTVKSA